MHLRVAVFLEEDRCNGKRSVDGTRGGKLDDDATFATGCPHDGMRSWLRRGLFGCETTRPPSTGCF